MKTVASWTPIMSGTIRLVYKFISWYVGCLMIRTTKGQYRNGRGCNIGDRGRREGDCRIPGVSRNCVTTRVRTAEGIDPRQHYGLAGGAMYWLSRSAVGDDEPGRAR